MEARPGARCAPRPSSDKASTIWRLVRYIRTTSSRGRPPACMSQRTVASPGRSGVQQEPGQSAIGSGGVARCLLGRNLAVDKRRHDLDGRCVARKPRCLRSHRRLDRSFESDGCLCVGRQRIHRIPLAPRWRRVDSASSLPPGVSTGQAWYDWYVKAAPDVDTEVYWARSKRIVAIFRAPLGLGRVISNHTGGAIHPDQHAIAFEPGNPNMVYVGCDGGLFRSPDRGNTWAIATTASSSRSSNTSPRTSASHAGSSAGPRITAPSAGRALPIWTMSRTVTAAIAASTATIRAPYSTPTTT